MAAFGLVCDRIQSIKIVLADQNIDESGGSVARAVTSYCLLLADDCLLTVIAVTADYLPHTHHLLLTTRYYLLLTTYYLLGTQSYYLLLLLTIGAQVHLVLITYYIGAHLTQHHRLVPRRYLLQHNRHEPWLGLGSDR